MIALMGDAALEGTPTNSSIPVVGCS